MKKFLNGINAKDTTIGVVILLGTLLGEQISQNLEMINDQVQENQVRIQNLEQELRELEV